LIEGSATLHAKIISYAQGMVQLGAASKLYNWSLNFGDIASIWRGGCIIRAQFLNYITAAYRKNPGLKNLILDPYFRDILVKTQSNWRTAVCAAIEHGVAVPSFGAALAYYDSYRQANLPARFAQAQRDSLWRPHLRAGRQTGRAILPLRLKINP
jgi:6-phosphogluconate dehydrogenase